MTKKYNEAVDELNKSLEFIEKQQAYVPTERTSVEIDNGLSNDDLDKLLGISNKGV